MHRATMKKKSPLKPDSFLRDKEGFMEFQKKILTISLFSLDKKK